MRSYIVRYMYSIITGGNLTMNSTTTNDNLKNVDCCSSCSTDLCGYHVRTNPTLGTGAISIRIRPCNSLRYNSRSIRGLFGWRHRFCLADLLGGYFIYVPITLAIKGLVALSSGILYQHMGKYFKSHYPSVILGGIADIILVAGGYFLCESIM